MKEKLIVYIADYYENSILEARKGITNISPAGNNKIIKMNQLFTEYGFKTVIINNNASPNNRSGKKYDKIEKEISESTKIIYTELIDKKFLNSILSIINTFICIKQLKKVYDIKAIVFYNFTIKNAIPAYLSKILLRIPIIVQYEDGYYLSKGKSVKNKMFWLLEYIGFKLIDGAILVTSLMKKKLKPDTPFCVIRGFINKEILNLQQKRRLKNNTIPQKPKTLLYSGRLDLERGILILLEALKKIDIELEVYITGYGPLKNKVQEEIHNINRSKQYLKIKFLDFLSLEEYRNLLINSDILVNPQRENSGFSEVSFPSKIYEYISAGNLVITSNVSDIEKLNKDMFVIYKNDSVEDLANAIEDIYYNYSKYQHYIKNIRIFAENECDNSTVKTDLYSLFNFIFNGRKL